MVIFVGLSRFITNTIILVSDYSLLMTEKQQNIINSGLKLFATEGYDSTSTIAIAKDAGVSEGLIFRHFKNKEGLLEAIIGIGLSKANSYFESVIGIIEPGERIKTALSLPFNVDTGEYNSWRLTYALKWQRGVYESPLFEVFQTSLAEAFSELGYDDPDAEAKLVEVFIDGMATEILLKDGTNAAPLLETILKKYKLN